MNDPLQTPALNAYLSTQNNDAAAAGGGLGKEPGMGGKVDRDGVGPGAAAGAGKDGKALGRGHSQSPTKAAEAGGADHQSDATHATGKTKQSRKSHKSSRSGRSDRSVRRQHLRERYQTEKAVDEYARDKPLDDLEKYYEYNSDEESVYAGFELEPRRIPAPLATKFFLDRESGASRAAVRDMIRRFNEKTQTYEFMIKFNITVEKTDESSISLAGNTPGEIVDQKERRRYIRKEMRIYNDEEANTLKNKTREALDRGLFDSLLEVITRAHQLLNVMYEDTENPNRDHLKYIEMQLNMQQSILEKAKIVCLKLDKIFILIPYTVSKIEIRMRNIMINNRSLLDGISHFMNFYLIN